MMKIEILQSGKWLNLLVIDDKTFPTVKIIDDSQNSGYQALIQFNDRVASLRIDGIEGRYGIDFDGALFLEADKPGYCYLSIAKAIQFPPGSTFTLVKDA